MGCSLRLLREHMLAEVVKFKKYDAAEATESGKERPATKWANEMKNLVAVWDCYEEIVHSDILKKGANIAGRGSATKTKEQQAEAARIIRAAAVGNRKQYLSNSDDYMQGIPVTVEMSEEACSGTSTQPHATSAVLCDMDSTKRCIQGKRKTNNEEMWETFMRKSKIEIESKERVEMEKVKADMAKIEMERIKNELEADTKKVEDRNTMEKILVEKRKLELEIEKLAFEKKRYDDMKTFEMMRYEEDRQQRQKTQELLNELLKAKLNQ